jgi:hypothetical protein
MASVIKIASGSKLQLALDVPVGQEPDFGMVSTFKTALDDSAFLISVPMKNGQPLPMDESRKLLIRYAVGDQTMLLAGYPDDEVEQGLHRYWKIRRVSEQRQFFKRADERLKVALRVQYRQDTWPLNSDGQIDREDGMSLDISAGGAAFYCNRVFDVGEVCMLSLPRVGTDPAGQAIEDTVAVVCWMRQAPKGSVYRQICGVQFRFGDGSEREQMQAYVSNVKAKYKL